MINDKFHNHDKLYDKITSNTRSLYNHLLLKNGYTQDQLLQYDMGREYIMPLLEKQYLFNNDIKTNFGYPVLNGKKIHFEHAIKYKVKENDIVIFASDGYPIIKNTLEESEESLKRILENDSLCINEYKSTKGITPGNNSYDDRTYIKFII